VLWNGSKAARKRHARTGSRGSTGVDDPQQLVVDAGPGRHEEAKGRADSSSIDDIGRRSVRGGGVDNRKKIIDGLSGFYPI